MSHLNISPVFPLQCIISYPKSSHRVERGCSMSVTGHARCDTVRPSLSMTAFRSFLNTHILHRNDQDPPTWLLMTRTELGLIGPSQATHLRIRQVGYTVISIGLSPRPTHTPQTRRLSALISGWDTNLQVTRETHTQGQQENAGQHPK